MPPIPNYYWYGSNCHSVGGTPKWVEGILSSSFIQTQNDDEQDNLSDSEHMAEPIESIENEHNDYIFLPGEPENILNDATLNVEHAEGPKDVSTEQSATL